MERSCCEFRQEDGLEVKVFETENGYRIEMKGDKDKVREWKQSCCGEKSFRFSCCK